MNRMERRFGWMAFPGFLRFYAILHAMVYVLQVLRPDIGFLLEFDRDLILQGEVWRLVTFLFASSGFAGIGAFGPTVDTRLWIAARSRGLSHTGSEA